MNKLLLTLMLSLSLVGCATTRQGDPKPSVVVEYKYVTNPIPDEVLYIPPQVKPLDFKADPKPTQRDVAKWIAESELRTSIMEKNLMLLKKHQDNQTKK